MAAACSEETTDNTVITVIFLVDGWVANVEDFETHGISYTSGDTLTLEREDLGGEEHLAVVLGAGSTDKAADEQARIYVARLRKWHGQEGDEEIVVFGHNITESQLFDFCDNAEGNSSETEVH